MGSNVGDRRFALQRAISRLRHQAHVSILAVSRFHETTPIGGPGGQGAFLNAALTLETDLTAAELFRLLQDVEQQIGRVRRERWSERILDLDLLLYDQQVMTTSSLVVPHPRMAFRPFVLVPAVEIAPDLIHPCIGWTLHQILDHLSSPHSYVAVTGIPATAASRLVKEIANRCRARLVAVAGTRERRHGDTDDSTGVTLETELEFLMSCVRKLEEASGQASGWMVSDFWLGELRVSARRRLARPELPRYENAWKEAIRDVVTPKLRVFLNASAGTIQSTAGATSPSDVARLSRLQDDLRQEVMLPGMGPMLEVNAADFDWAVAEVEAAIQAMGELLV
jgi:2-amino-4-hydroxy-6-hydroxymethyldihydropteridine diphosphokinase